MIGLAELLGIDKAGVFSVQYKTEYEANVYARKADGTKGGDRSRPTPPNLTKVTAFKVAVVNLSKQSYDTLIQTGKIERTAEEVAHAAEWNKTHTQWFKHYQDSTGKAHPFVIVGNTPATTQVVGIVVYKLGNTMPIETTTTKYVDATGAEISPEQFAIWSATYGPSKKETDVFVIKSTNILALKHGAISLVA